MQLHKLKRFYSKIWQGEGKEKRLYLLNEQGQKISFWNDIKLRDETNESDVFNIGIEVPYYKLAKMEVSTEEDFHPIKQDLRINKHNKQLELRYYGQFPFFNYGYFPQTWEKPEKQQSNKIEGQFAELKGDNDPLDVVELGSKSYEVGSIEKVKVLGSICLIDQGEIDWKVFAINYQQAQTMQIQSLDHLQAIYPG